MRRRAGVGAFTLIELLIVIVIIAILAALVIGIIGRMRTSARSHVTVTRVQNVLDGLVTYAQTSGSAVALYQERLPLGGVTSYSSLQVLSDLLAAGGAGRQMPALLVKPDSTQQAWASTGDEAAQQQGQWRDVVDATPAATGAVATSWYAATWPCRWPETDWYRSPLGTQPPILPFPWGKPGLTIEGQLCDPQKDWTTRLGDLVEYKEPASWSTAGLDAWRVNNSTDPNTSTHIDVLNAFAAYGAGAGPIWTYATASGGQTDQAASTVKAVRSDGSAVEVTPNLPLPFDLGYLSPLLTIEFLKAAGALASDGETAYRTDRKSSRLWNDGWGNPLVVSYALFQPGRFKRVADGENRRDLFLKSALAAYQYNRSLYLSAGAVGPATGAQADLAALAASSTPAGDRPCLAALWKRIGAACGAAGVNETTFDSPPWKGVKTGTAGGQRCFLASPLELR